MSLLRYSLLTFILCQTNIMPSQAQGTPQKPVPPKPASTTTVKPPQKPKWNPTFFTHRDSLFERWIITPGVPVMDTYHNYGATVDKNGDLYAILLNDAGKPFLGRLENSDWIDANPPFPESVEKLHNDGNGNVYAQTNKFLYLLSDDGWTPVLNINTNPRISTIGPDGRIYMERSRQNSLGESIGNEIFRMENGNVVPVMVDGAHLYVEKKQKYLVDRNGDIYLTQEMGNNNYYSPPRTALIIVGHMPGGYRLATDPLPFPYDFAGFNAANELIVAAGDGTKTETSYMKRLVGNKWEDIPIPKGTQMRKTIIDDQGYLCIITEESASNMTMRRYVNGVWQYEFFFKYNPFEPINFDRIAIGGSKIYGLKLTYVSAKKKYYMDVYEKSGVWKYLMMEVAKIPSEFDPNAPEMENYKNIRSQLLFREGNLYGIQDYIGRVMIEPVFDQISAVRTPASALAVKGDQEVFGYHDYCYQLISGADSIHVMIGYRLKYNEELQGFRMRPSIECGYCKGRGKLEDKRVRVQTRAEEHIPGRTVSGTQYKYEKAYDGFNGNYTRITKTESSYVSGGSTRPAEYEWIIVPGEKCPLCKGKSLPKAYETYFFDPRSHKYIGGWNR